MIAWHLCLVDSLETCATVRVQSFVFHALYTAYDESVLPKKKRIAYGWLS